MDSRDEQLYREHAMDISLKMIGSTELVAIRETSDEPRVSIGRKTSRCDVRHQKQIVFSVEWTIGIDAVADRKEAIKNRSKSVASIPLLQAPQSDY